MIVNLENIAIDLQGCIYTIDPRPNCRDSKRSISQPRGRNLKVIFFAFRCHTTMLQKGEGDYPADVEIQLKDPDFSEKHIEFQRSDSTIEKDPSSASNTQYETDTGEVEQKVSF